MKTYYSKTANGGKTIILDNVNQAIEYGLKHEGMLDGLDQAITNNSGNTFVQCCEAITKGDNEFKKKVDNGIDDLIGLVDDICPLFKQEHSGYERTSEGITSTADLVAAGEELCSFKKKSTPFKLKKGSGEGAYRLIINTDVSWWGRPEDNCTLVGCIVILLQRYAPVEIWIQQGWLAYDKSSISKDDHGVTLFKLDYTGAWDVTSLAFWITHHGKDIPFSCTVNRALGRKYSATSCKAEIECDLMCRGDWMRPYMGKDYYAYSQLMYTERLDIMANYVSDTAMKIVVDNSDETPLIEG